MDCQMCGYDIRLNEIDIECWSPDNADVHIRIYCPGCGAEYVYDNFIDVDDFVYVDYEWE